MPITAENVANLLQYALIAWLVILAGAVFYRVLLQGRALSEMLRDERGAIVPERVGSLFIILIVAGYYLLTGTSADLIYDEATNSYWMPDIPESLLILLTGGHSVFLAGKLARPTDRSS